MYYSSKTRKGIRCKLQETIVNIARNYKEIGTKDAFNSNVWEQLSQK